MRFQVIIRLHSSRQMLILNDVELPLNYKPQVLLAFPVWREGEADVVGDVERMKCKRKCFFFQTNSSTLPPTSLSKTVKSLPQLPHQPGDLRKNNIFGVFASFLHSCHASREEIK